MPESASLIVQFDTEFTSKGVLADALNQIEGVQSVIHGGALAVTISWPEDPDRGSETYGPFNNQEEQSKWVDDCVEAAKHGWRILDGAHYLLHRIEAPFDPNALWERVDGMKAEFHA